LIVQATAEEQLGQAREAIERLMSTAAVAGTDLETLLEKNKALEARAAQAEAMRIEFGSARQVGAVWGMISSVGWD
jgi:hypothetical protein